MNEIYEDVLCEEQPDGRYSCKLFKEPMFVNTPAKDEKPLVLKTPDGAIELWSSEDAVEYNANRKYDLVDNIGTIDVYDAHYEGINVEHNKTAIEIIPSKSKVMRCEVRQGAKKRILRCTCAAPVMVKVNP